MIKLKRDFSGAYSYSINSVRNVITEIKKGHWEILRNNDFLDTASTLREARALIELNLENNYTV